MAYPTLAEVKTYIGVAGATEDATITQIRAGIIKDIERFCMTED